LLLLLGGGGSALQLDTICATPAFTSSIQVESDICEQVPAFNLQKTYCSCWLGDDPPPLSGGGESSLLEQEKVKAKASPKVAANAILENDFLIVDTPILEG
jgi:hypothetical protein